MPSATSTKPKRVSPKTPNKNAQAIIQKRLEENAAIVCAAHNLIDNIAARTPKLEDTELSPSELSLIEQTDFGMRHRATDVHGVIRLLRHSQSKRKLLDELGTTNSIEIATCDVEGTADAVQKVRGTIDEIDVSESPEPAIVRQIAKLQQQLDQLKSEHYEAESRLERLKNVLESLKTMAPNPLQEIVATRKSRLRRTRDFMRLNKLKPEIHGLETSFDSGQDFSYQDIERLAQSTHLDNYLIENCPGCIEAGNGGFKTIDRDSFKQHVEFIRHQKLPELRKERDELRSTCDAAVAECETPILEWIDNDCVLTPESLTASGGDAEFDCLGS